MFRKLGQLISRSKLIKVSLAIALFIIMAGFFSGQPTSFKTGKYQVKVNLISKRLQKGNNLLTFIVTNKDGLPMNVNVRGKVFNKEMSKKITTDIKTLEKGVYQSVIDLPENGEWLLALDMDSEDLGHGDLVFVLDAGKPLHLLAATSEEVKHYTCAMHPSVNLTVDGQCPICGMDLVLVKKQGKQDAGTITVNGKKRQLIGVTTEEVKKGTFTKTIRAAGKINYDESRLTEITLKYDAWVETLEADDIGQSITKGDSLFNIYSPELLSAQQEYLAAFHSSKEYKIAATEKLKLWGVNSQQLKELQKRGKIFLKLPVLSPVSGVVVSKNIIQGTVIKSGSPLLRIADLSKVWLEASIYQSDLPWIKEGVKVKITVDDIPNHQWQSVIKRVDPFIDPLTYTAGIRLEIDNKDGLLRPNMYATASIKVDMGERLLISESAVIFSGNKRIVFLDLGNGRLKPTQITTGLQNKDSIEVISGLNVGDKITSSGHFLIASESKLTSGLKQW
ncbi:MAG: efflux RND transporter periplasmic adaptor subunit [Methylococcales bacterium]|nr:efflux RND transporter periplasmic adaptor subunit [Methylococcales bacterium]